MSSSRISIGREERFIGRKVMVFSLTGIHNLTAFASTYWTKKNIIERKRSRRVSRLPAQVCCALWGAVFVWLDCLTRHRRRTRGSFVASFPFFWQYYKHGAPPERNKPKEVYPHDKQRTGDTPHASCPPQPWLLKLRSLIFKNFDASWRPWWDLYGYCEPESRILPVLISKRDHSFVQQLIAFSSRFNRRE